jgi:hypothetical protein
MRSLRLAAAVLLLAGLTGCQPATGTTGAAASAAASASRSATARPAGTGVGGAGSLTLDLTSPVRLTGHVNTKVTCSTASRTYRASGSSASVAGYRVDFGVTVKPYRGPGDYPASTVTLKLDGPSGTVDSGSVLAPVTITDSGRRGHFTLDVTVDGRRFAGTLAWACS